MKDLKTYCEMGISFVIQNPILAHRELRNMTGISQRQVKGNSVYVDH